MPAPSSSELFSIFAIVSNAVPVETCGCELRYQVVEGVLVRQPTSFSCGPAAVGTPRRSQWRACRLPCLGSCAPGLGVVEHNYGDFFTVSGRGVGQHHRKVAHGDEELPVVHIGFAFFSAGEYNDEDSERWRAFLRRALLLLPPACLCPVRVAPRFPRCPPAQRGGPELAALAALQLSLPAAP
eukprot:624220-Amphidinium_carterae.2